MRAMNQQELNQYMNDLLSGNRKVEGLEVTALQHFRRITADTARAQQRLQQVTTEGQQLTQEIQRANGQREAYATLLKEAEEARLPDLPDVEPTTDLEGLRKKMGASKVELVRNDGKVIAEESGGAAGEEAKTEVPIGDAEPKTEVPADQEKEQGTETGKGNDNVTEGKPGPGSSEPTGESEGSGVVPSHE